MKSYLSLTLLVAKTLLSTSFTQDVFKVAPYHCHSSHPNAAPLKAHKLEDVDRRGAIKQVIGVAALTLVGSKAEALVEGNPVPGKKKSLPEEYMQGTLGLADMDANAAVPESAYRKLPSGTIYADLRVGGGDVEIKEGSRVNLQWVLRKSNGYFVDSSAVQDSVPFIFTVGDGGAIKGIDEGIQGMKQGGTRRILIPPSLAYVEGLDDGKPGPMPAGFGPRQQMRRVQNVRKDVPGEYVFLEVQVTRVR